MNFSIGDEIIDVYAGLLENPHSSNLYYPYAYMDLKGYDFIDIKNALYLMTAYRVYTASIIDDTSLASFKKYADEDGGAIILYFSLFIPDNEKAQTDKLDKKDPEYNSKTISIISDFQESEGWKEIMKAESISSFLDYCLKIKGDTKYWHAVYKRIGIECDSRDEHDRIYYFIKEELCYQSNNANNQIKIDDETNAKHNTEKVYDSFFSRYKTALVYFLFVVLFSFSVPYKIVRVPLFWVLLLTNLSLIWFSIKEKLFETSIMKFKFVMNIILATALIVGLYSSVWGLYVTIFCLASSVFEFLRHLVSNKSKSKSLI